MMRSLPEKKLSPEIGIKHIAFVGSMPTPFDLPKEERPTFVLVGRSNVGKSSLINMLMQRKGLAKISSTPGKTRMINYFLVDKSWYVVDLPGYGWAQVSQTLRKKWALDLRRYLQHVPQLVHLFLLIDGRHPPQKIDMDFIRELYVMRLPFTILFTKKDLVNKGVAQRHRVLFKETLAGMGLPMPPCLATSSRKKEGRQTLLQQMHEHLKDFRAGFYA